MMVSAADSSKTKYSEISKVSSMTITNVSVEAFHKLKMEFLIVIHNSYTRNSSHT